MSEVLSQSSIPLPDDLSQTQEAVVNVKRRRVDNDWTLLPADVVDNSAFQPYIVKQNPLQLPRKLVHPRA